MEISCDHCGAQYRFDASQVPQGGYQAQCTSCQGVFDVPDPGDSTQLSIACPSCQTLYQFSSAAVPPEGYQAVCSNCQSTFAVPGATSSVSNVGNEQQAEPDPQEQLEPVEEVATAVISLINPEPERRLTTPGGAWDPVSLDSGTFGEEVGAAARPDLVADDSDPVTRSQRIHIDDVAFQAEREPSFPGRTGASLIMHRPRLIGFVAVLLVAMLSGVLARRMQERSGGRSGSLEQVHCGEPSASQQQQVQQWIARIALDEEQELVRVARELSGAIEQPGASSALYGLLVVVEVLRSWDQVLEPIDVYDGGTLQSDQVGATLARAGRAWHKVAHCSKEGWVGQAAWFWSMANGLPQAAWLESGSRSVAAAGEGSGELVAWQDVARAEIAYQWFRQHHQPGPIWANKVTVEGSIEQLGQLQPLRRTLLRLAEMYVEQGTHYGKGLKWLKELSSSTPAYSKAVKAMQYAPPAPIGAPPLEGSVEQIMHAISPPSAQESSSRRAVGRAVRPARRSAAGSRLERHR